MELIEDGADLLSSLDEYIGALGPRTEQRAPGPMPRTTSESWLPSVTVSMSSLDIADTADTVSDSGNAPLGDSGIDTGQTRQMFGSPGAGAARGGAGVRPRGQDAGRERARPRPRDLGSSRRGPGSGAGARMRTPSRSNDVRYVRRACTPSCTDRLMEG